MINDGKEYFVYNKCPGNLYYSEIPCPIPLCEPGYYARPYHCKFNETFIEGDRATISKNPGEFLGVVILIDKEYKFELNKTVNFLVMDKIT